MIAATAPAGAPEAVAALCFFAGAILLIASGAGHLGRPGHAERALSSAGLPAGPRIVRMLGLAECAAGLAALVRPGPVAAGGVALLYAGFAGFLVRLLRDGKAASCGCLGRHEAPPTWLHVALDIVAAGVALWAGFRGIPGLWPTARPLPLHGATFVAGTGLVAYLSYLMAAFLPDAVRIYRGTRSDQRTPPAEPARRVLFTLTSTPRP